MHLSPPVHLSARVQSEPSRWELVLRYAAATAATLLAIAGAQLVTPNSFIWILTALTLTGVPVSLYLRLNEMRIGSFVLPRPLLNSLTVLTSFGAAAYLVFLPMSDFFLPLLRGNTPPYFWLRFGGGEPVEALMRLFLLFAAFRSFALISDKDATLTTVPSFSVLLLMIPIHKGIEVVVYFVAWTFVAATLFALDHRSEVREGVSATVPAIIAGQDVRLGGRSLATILGVSLTAAIGISLFLTSRNPEERSSAESAVTALATRLTNLALSLPEVSANSGPERQIDFKSGPNLPSRAPLWQVEASTRGREPMFPTYWRMFTLSNYNGVSWTQTDSRSIRVGVSSLSLARWPLRRNRGYFGPGGFSVLPPNFTFPGFDVQKADPKAASQFGKQRIIVRQSITSLVPNIGFLPVQPAVRAVVIPEGQPKEIRVRSDGAVDIGVVQINQQVRVLSDVPLLPEYGVRGQHIPSRRPSATQLAASGVTLSPRERRINLNLPLTVPRRVRQLGASMLSHMPKNASNWVKAQRIALEMQDGAVYTLRPPSIPDDRDATDYFLFDGGRRGYCTYFAGALTVLCRTQGIPARVVSGFGGLDWGGNEGGLLREGNAHAWTEVWCDGFGWTVVDATPPGDRGDNAPTWIENWGDWVSSSVTNSLMVVAAHRKWLAVVPILLLFGLIARKKVRRGGGWKWKNEREDDFERRIVGQIYRRCARTLTRKFRPRSPWETPDEWLQFCARELSTPDTESLRRLTALYLAARYGSKPLPRGSARLARETASNISWKRLKSAEIPDTGLTSA